jgi:hypothetical protein
MLATAWLALTLSNFRQTPFLGKRKREIVSDYALPLAVCAMTLVANNWFGDVPSKFPYILTIYPNANANVPLY